MTELTQQTRVKTHDMNQNLGPKDNMKQPTSLSSPQEGTCTCKGPKKASRSSKSRTCVRHIDVLNCKDSVTKEVRRNKKTHGPLLRPPLLQPPPGLRLSKRKRRSNKRPAQFANPCGMMHVGLWRCIQCRRFHRIAANPLVAPFQV